MNYTSAQIGASSASTSTVPHQGFVLPSFTIATSNHLVYPANHDAISTNITLLLQPEIEIEEHIIVYETLFIQHHLTSTLLLFVGFKF
eukprot:scaffold4733_cov170-Alexandrium_tamarense.AAC.18